MGGLVNYKLDIFRTLPDGQFLWIEAVEGLEEAKSQLNKLAEEEPGDYFIYDTHQGCRVEFLSVARQKPS